MNRKMKMPTAAIGMTKTLASSRKGNRGVLLPPWLAVGALIAVALGLRLHGIAGPNLWLDEANSWQVATYPLGEIFGHLQASPAGPFYFLLLKLWMAAFGDSETALRSLSLLASLALLPVTYAMGARLLSPGATLLGTLLLALSPVQLYFGQEARMYMLLSLLTACCALAYLAWWDVWSDWPVANAPPAKTGVTDRCARTIPDEARSARVGPLALCVLFGTLSLYTHYIAALLLIALNADALLRFANDRHRFAGDRERGVRRRHRAGQWIGAQAAIVLLLVPFVIGVNTESAAASQGWRPSLGYAGALRAFFLFFLQSIHGIYYYTHDLPRAAAEFWHTHASDLRTARSFAQLLVVYPLTLLAVVAALAYPPNRTAAGVRDTYAPVWTLYLCLFLPLVAGLFVSVEHGLQFTRYLLFVSPFLFLLLGAGLVRMPVVGREATLTVLIVSMLLGLSRYGTVAGRDSDYRPVAELLQRLVDREDRVLLYPDEVGDALYYYLRGSPIRPEGVKRTQSLTGRLEPRPGSRTWVVIDYRSELYRASPAKLRRALGSEPILQKRYDSGGNAGVLILAVGSGERS